MKFALWSAKRQGEVRDCFVNSCEWQNISKNHKIMTSSMSCLLQIASVLWWFYFSKIVELFDTVSSSSFNQSVSAFLLHSHVSCDVFSPHTKTKCCSVRVEHLVQECCVMTLPWAPSLIDIPVHFTDYPPHFPAVCV